MVEFQRIIDLTDIEHKSLFLFGPRQTGKSFLLRKRFPHWTYYNLLDSRTYLRLMKNPAILKEELLASQVTTPIIIDEVQRIPQILNEVHLLIEEFGFKFLLTGSSARKLKQGGANLLGGRALEKRLFPLTTFEIGDYDFIKLLNLGSLPAISNSKIPEKELEAYVGTYLKEEIQAEGLIRRLEPFSEFLELASLTNTELVNYANLASDIGVSAKTVKEYYQVLEDTMIGKILKPYSKTLKRKPVRTPKFFFFDLGVANTLGYRRHVVPKSDSFGKCFEHLVFCELNTYLHYKEDPRALTFWRSKNQQEVDFLIGDDIAIEVKGTNTVQKKHLRGLKALSEEISLKKKIIVSLDQKARLIEHDYLVLPFHDFAKRLWEGDLENF